MKKKILTILLCAPFLNTVAQSLTEKYAARLTPPREYTCYRTDTPIKIDGIADEPSWQKAARTAPFVDISGEGFPTPKYITTTQMLWDDNFLYVAARLQEDDIKANLTRRDTIIYYDNDFEVFIDPDGDCRNYFEIEVNARNVLFDLMLDRPYRSGGNFMVQWDCPGLKCAVHLEGTLNNPSDTDRAWSVEMAIPHQALTMNFDNPLKVGQTWRINFSRVEWLKKGRPEENWVWSPTGRIDMHMPERWGYLHFSEKCVEEAEEMIAANNADRKDIKIHHKVAYRLLWAMFYAQQDYYATNKEYLSRVEDFKLISKETSLLPKNAKIEMEATKNQFLLSVSIPDEGIKYTLNAEGQFKEEKIGRG